MKSEDGFRVEESPGLTLDAIWTDISRPDTLERANGSSMTRNMLPGSRLEKALACG
jgi:hypothetical protein